MALPSQVIFLPGASGRVTFWEPLAGALKASQEYIYFGYPGFGGAPVDNTVCSLSDIVARLNSTIDQPTALVAQSMGGVIAIMSTLANPGLITHLVLIATSGGLDMRSFGARDWRSDYMGGNCFPEWFLNYDTVLEDELSDVRAKVLLIWGDDDPYSPVAVGERLASLLPDAHLYVVEGGDHELGRVHAGEIAALVDAHFTR